ncbi:hypothetical protein PNOK_0566500 [Pyrrhoderma noxium]|uniref:GmrSD restriction endonucleases N-terminal domain-containing protein n=1 Tax=Pyrrhoderma noxium TaxID=2282107 RepID=A0A286UGT2_9AGAM|nr:hypothetical protein PNOK_0566500 [Pyrrhoderma noxium]
MSDDESYDELSDYGDAEEYDENPNHFRIRDPLPQSTATTYTTKELHNLIHEGEIDLSPSYQRAFVWSKEKQMTLIESIFRNFYIPPVLFLSRKSSKIYEAPRVCMDGKQRLSSIQAFIDGQIPYKDPVTKKLFYYTVPNTQAKKKLVIPENYKAIFNSKTITCIIYDDISPEIERDMFQRVQLGVSLTAAEKLAAISSPYADWITELDHRHVRGIDDGLNMVLRWDASRGKHFMCIAQIAYCCENLPGRSDPISSKLSTWLNREDAPGHQLKEEINDLLARYWHLASTEEFKHGFAKIKQIVAPVEFVFVGVLIHVLRDCSDEIIADEIFNMRREVRALHKDVRANTRVITTMWDFIDQAKARHGNKTNGGRKRRRDPSDLDNEYRSTPIRNLGKGIKTRPKN